MRLPCCKTAYLHTLRHSYKDRHFYESINGGTPVCIDADIPFEIPDSWEWVRLSNILSVSSGKVLPSNKLEDNGAYPVYGGNGIVGHYSSNNVDSGTLLIGRVGALCGNTHITKSPAWVTDNALICAFDSSKIRIDYLRIVIDNLELRQKSNSTAQPVITGKIIYPSLIPLPPYSEQYRIIQGIEHRLGVLLQIKDSRSRYKRILSETPTSLRQQLIQSAIQGQLVPQNPNDEPASVLLERIAEERTAKLGKKSAKSMSRIVRRGSKTYELFPDGTEKDISEDIPFEIPCSWEWARGKSIFDETKNRVPETDFSYIDIDAIDNKRHKIKSGKPTKKEEAPSRARRILESGDVLFSLVRPYLENIALVEKQYVNAIASTGFYVVRSKVIIPEFTYSLFLSPYVIQGLNSFMKGDNSPSIRSENIEEFLYPVPPHAEQQRIARILNKTLSYIAL